MALFSRKPSVVSVNFRGLLDESALDPGASYSYVWGLKEKPRVGLRVWVRGGDGRRAAAVVAAVGNVSGYPASAPVLAVVTREEIEAAFAFERQVEWEWLDMARRAAGLSSSSRRRKVPEGFPPIAPIEGDVPAVNADEFGRMWWRAFKLAEARGLPVDEVQRFHSIASGWFAVRDRNS